MVDSSHPWIIIVRGWNGIDDLECVAEIEGCRSHIGNYQEVNHWNHPSKGRYRASGKL
jgi:hypothetical protein